MKEERNVRVHTSGSLCQETEVGESLTQHWELPPAEFLSLGYIISKMGIIIRLFEEQVRKCMETIQHGSWHMMNS